MSLNRTAVDVPSNTDVSVEEKINDTLDVTKEEDEEVEFVTSRSPSVEMSDLGDPAILQVGITASCSVKFKYSKDHLLKLKESPFSLKRPDYLDSAYDNNNGIWDPERWHFDRKATDPSTENGNRGNDMDNNHRRRSGDAKDRIRREHDGIVLSPQRRSFNSGCYVPVREPARSNRSHSPIGKGEASHIGHREISQGPSTRKIGSGRIFFDYSEKPEVDDFGYRRERRDTDRERDERYDRRSYSRESEPHRPNKSKDGGFTRNGARYDRRRISNESREEEPEWFSEGPISQHDTIELRGFDDVEKSGGVPNASNPSGKKKMSAAQKKKAKERGANAKNAENSVQNSSAIPKEEAGKQEGPGARSTPTLLETGNTELVQQSPIGDKGAAGDTSEAANVRNSAILDDQLFTIEDMLKSDNINMLLPNGVGLESGDTSGSKFSRWFSREKSPPNAAANQKQSDGSRRSSLQDDHHHLIKNILNDISEPTVSIPCDSNSYFAPISPAASTGSVPANPGHPQAAAQLINFMEILQRSGKHHQGGPLHADLPPAMKSGMEVPGKLLCVEELETRIRQGDKGGNPGEVPTNIRMSAAKHNKTKEDNSAFQKLLAQMQDGHVIPASNGPIPQQKTQPMSIMEMLSHSQKQEEAAHLAQMMNSSVSQGHLPNDLNYKLQQSQAQQRQIEVFSKLLASGVRQQQTRTPPPLNDIGLAGRELLNRPEAQAILQGLKRGDITPQHLYQQLANPAMQTRHRELLQMILKLQSPTVAAAAAAGSRVLSPVPPHPMFQQQQQLRVSPLPPNAMHQRIPSPRELQVHTQHIMQRALIKKKLEEQQENFRKKQELQQSGQSPGGISPAKNVASPTQLAFTPTAVLRKMTAEKDEGNKESANKNNDTQTKSHQQQGRAVTGMRNQGQQSQQAGSQTQQSVQQQVVESQGQMKQVQQQTQWNTQFQQMNKQPGRPIVKNNANFQQPQQSQQQAQYDQFLLQQRLMTQQQRKQQNQQFGGLQQGQYGGLQQFPNSPQQYSQLPHQLRAQHQQQQQPHMRPQQQQQQQQQPGLNQQWQQIIQQNQSFDNRQIGRGGGGNDGDMSLTSNQLASWFTPDLLERARKGKLPSMPASGRAQHALSLEEIERQTAPVIHN